MMQLVLSLFPGIGMLDHAFELEGFCVVRGPDVIWGGDVRRFHPPRGRFDGVIGGPPCQSFSSMANLIRARGLEPKFGNLIPEFERVVSEALPAWFLMENVRKAPIPVVDGYGVHNFTLCNSALGEAQRRLRRFSFGLRGGSPVDLRRWIDLVPLMLPDRQQAVTSAGRPVPVALGGSGKLKATRQQTVTGRNAGEPSSRKAQFAHYSIGQMLELQGLPPDFLDHCPFTASGLRKVIGNGVPIPMGRALARAINAALELLTPAGEPPAEE